ncbi:MAG: tRNA (cytidine(34)-2'-O)-methyltransferase [Verrucomicrobiia bacterium]
MNVVLIEPEIPPNTGNVGRLCAATGATLHLVGPLGFRLDDRELKRAGMDYWQHITWKYWDSFDDLLAQAMNANPHPNPLPRTSKGEGISSPRSRREDQGEGPRFYFVETKAPRLYTEPRYKWGDYLVFGRETAGLPKELLEANADTTITIPMFNPDARSLNLATAVAIVLYEAMRQVKGF